MKTQKIILLTFDIEEWFQVANLSAAIKREDWGNKRSSVEQNVDRILQILEKYKITATFFILGWVAERHPDIIVKIYQSGHEISSHGYGHELANRLAEDEIINDIHQSQKTLSGIIGAEILGYRAPNFSINDQILKQLKNFGFLYDSSYNPFRLNPRYGTLEGLGQKVSAGCYLTNSGIYEVPLSSYSFFKFPVPIAGGAYFRILPFWFFKWLVKGKIKQEPVYNFYLHPWEFEPDQERVKNIRWDYRLRHYHGLLHTAEKLEKLIVHLKENGTEFLTIGGYINRIRSSNQQYF